MDTIKNILHPKASSVHAIDDTTDTVATKQDEEGTATTTPHHHHHHRPPQHQQHNKEPFPHEVQQDQLNREGGFDPTDTSSPQPRAGHHHPRQPVGATGLPPNHKPRQHFAPPQQHQQQQQQQQKQGVTGGVGSHVNHDDRDRQQELLLADMRKQEAEEGNNFPGTNPHPAHSALGNQSMTGEKGTIMPGRE